MATVGEHLWAEEEELEVEVVRGNVADVGIEGRAQPVVMIFFLEHEEQVRWEM